MLAVAGTLLMLLGAAGCSPAPRADEATFDSENPAAKLYAIHEAGEEHNAAAVPDLISSLDSDDPAVRLFSIKALEEITGERYGYSAYDPPQNRSVAIDRWVKAYQAGELKTPGQPKS